MRKRSEVAATKKAARAPAAPLTLAEVGDFVRRTGCSLHVRGSGDKIVVVAHLASETRAEDCEDRDIDHAVRTVMRALEGR